MAADARRLHPDCGPGKRKGALLHLQTDPKRKSSSPDEGISRRLRKPVALRHLFWRPPAEPEERAVCRRAPRAVEEDIFMKRAAKKATPKRKAGAETKAPRAKPKKVVPAASATLPGADLSPMTPPKKGVRIRIDRKSTRLNSSH